MSIKNSIGDKPLTVPEGGTGQTSLVQNGILIGEGTSAVTSLSGSINGDLLIGSTGGNPAWNQISSSDGSVTVSPGINSVTLSAASTGVVHSWTPTIIINPSTSFSYNIQLGEYVQVGNLIYWQMNVQARINNANGSGISFSGLPGNYNLSIPRYYFSCFLNVTNIPNNVPPWDEGYCYLDTATGIINTLYNKPSANNNSYSIKTLQTGFTTWQFYIFGFYFTN